MRDGFTRQRPPHLLHSMEYMNEPRKLPLTKDRLYSRLRQTYTKTIRNVGLGVAEHWHTKDRTTKNGFASIHCLFSSCNATTMSLFDLESFDIDFLYQKISTRS